MTSPVTEASLITALFAVSDQNQLKETKKKSVSDTGMNEKTSLNGLNISNLQPSSDDHLFNSHIVFQEPGGTRQQ